MTAWVQCMNINLLGAMYCLQEAARIMSAQKSASIINMSSLMGMQGYPMRSAYVASKFALIGITETMARELGPLVNALMPDVVQRQIYCCGPAPFLQTVRQIAADIGCAPQHWLEQSFGAASGPIVETGSKSWRDRLCHRPENHHDGPGHDPASGRADGRCAGAVFVPTRGLRHLPGETFVGQRRYAASGRHQAARD